MGSNASPRSSEGSPRAASERLDSWKEIAGYLRRDVSTVQRWEKREGMPVHRHLHDRLGSVYAFQSELDQWSRGRRAHADLVQAPDRAGNGRRPLVAVGLMSLLAASISYGLSPYRAATAPPARVASIVVFPLSNLSADPAEEYFAAGMTEELTGALAQIRTLRVVSRTSAMSLGGSGKSLPDIARELDVDAVLEGSIQRADDRVRIRLQLLHAPSDTHLWARDYERELSDVLALQNEVAREVAEEIRIRMAPEEHARMTSAARVDPAAHDEYLLGRYLLWKFIEDDRLRAIDHFQRAIQIEPSYAAAYAGLAHAWWMQGVFGTLSRKEAGPLASAAARKALELDGRLTEAHAAMAYVQGIFEWDWTGAEKTLRHAIDIDPNGLDARYVYALVLMALGRLADAEVQIAHAARLDPLSAQVHSTFGRILYRARKFDEAVLRLNRAIELEPRNPVAYSRLADVYEQLGRYTDALALLEKRDALVSHAGRRVSADVARVHARMGRRSEARQMLARVAHPSADVHVALGESDAAFALLFRSLDERVHWNAFVKADPQFDDLHADPRWNELLERMNLSN